MKIGNWKITHGHHGWFVVSWVNPVSGRKVSSYPVLKRWYYYPLYPYIFLKSVIRIIEMRWVSYGDHSPTGTPKKVENE